MSLDEFNLLPYERQLAIVFDEGSFLARRWEEEDGSISTICLAISL